MNQSLGMVFVIMKLLHLPVCMTMEIVGVCKIFEILCNNTHLTKIYYWFFTDCMWTFIHDGICDDNNNREECDWDGFDCCLEDIYIIDEYCNECLCHLDDENNNTSTEKGVPP